MKQLMGHIFLDGLKSQQGFAGIAYLGAIAALVFLGGLVWYQPSETKWERIESYLGEQEGIAQTPAEKNIITMVEQMHNLSNQNSKGLPGPCWITIGPENADTGEEVSIALDIARPLHNAVEKASCVVGTQTFTLPRDGGVVDYTIPYQANSDALLVSCVVTADGGGTTLCRANAWISPNCSPSILIHGQLYILYHSLYGTDGIAHCLTEGERGQYEYDNGGFDRGWTSPPQGACTKCP